ncbi:MFS transporter [Paraburkholderia acidisoli]|uniref:MFS transporter n=1 Tax=Paraburkholderia acidisoli TaxID=2571748 RepID=A0A7Z2JJF7_9BURK|nr:MFS transporter [Paraburkholderia acidisoli]QGZ65289.1 MFS transporter [Paraburkholderia acidisoli]
MTTPVNAPGLAAHPAGASWRYVIAGFIALIFGVNIVPVMFNLLGAPLSAEFGWTRPQISTGLAVFTFCDGLSMLAVGALVDRKGIKSVVPMAFAFGGGLIALAFTPPQIEWMYLLCAIIGLGAGAVAPTVYSIVITAWFDASRGLALGILNVGLGLCGTLMPFLLSYLLKTGGWRGAVMTVGGASMVLALVNLVFVLRMPSGWERERRNARSQGKVAGASLATLAKSKHLWLIALSIFFVSAATYGLLSQMVLVTVDKGIAMSVALTALSTISLSSVCSRMIVGALLDRLFAPLLAAFIFVLTAAGVLLLTYTSAVWGIYLAALLVGVGLGAEGDVAAYILSRYVPKASYGRAFGLVMFLFAQGGGLGVFVLGKSYGVLGSYTAALYLIVALVLLAALFIAILGPYRYSVDRAPEQA